MTDPGQSAAIVCEPCTRKSCVNGKITHCELDDHGWPTNEREESCAICDGRGYFLPEPGVYRVKVADVQGCSVAVVDGDGPAYLRTVSFNDCDWDMSQEFDVQWLYKIDELEPSSGSTNPTRSPGCGESNSR